MEPKDLFELISGLIWGIGMLIIWNRNKSQPKIWPRIFGVGGGVYIFILLMIRSLLRGPEFLHDIVVNLLFSLVFGTVCYFSGRELARRFGRKQ
jgi:hypothetical protein